MALGALRGDVVRMILGESLRIAAFGLAVGLPLSVGMSYLLRSQLYRLSSFDSLSIAVALAITLLVSVGAALLPARQASSVDPMEAIRSKKARCEIKRVGRRICVFVLHTRLQANALIELLRIDLRLRQVAERRASRTFETLYNAMLPRIFAIILSSDSSDSIGRHFVRTIQQSSDPI